jgi:hypothetical protein
MMKAKCPHCRNGCEKCDGGYFEASIAVGDWYTRHCNQCGFDNGCRVATEFMPPFAEWAKPNPCIYCKNEDMQWLLVAKSTERVGKDES